MYLFLSAFFVWAFFHSLTTSHRFKNWVIHLLGQRIYDGWYRLLYNIVSVVTFLPLLLFGRVLIPNDVVWRIDSPLSLLFYAIQLIGILGLLISLWQTDVFRFAGLSQVMHFLDGRADVYVPPKMVTHGTYAIVRHPLYFFSILFLWFSPVMTLQMFVFNLAATLYFVVGSIHEERRLQAVFGEEYDRYRSRVPGMFPIKIR